MTCDLVVIFCPFVSKLRFKVSNYLFFSSLQVIPFYRCNIFADGQCSQPGDMYYLRGVNECYICACFIDVYGSLSPKCSPCSGCTVREYFSHEFHQIFFSLLLSVINTIANFDMSPYDR